MASEWGEGATPARRRGPHTGLSKHLPKTAQCPSDWALPSFCPLLSTHRPQRSRWKCHRRAPSLSPWVVGGCEANSIPWGGSGDLQSPLGCVELLWEPPGARDHPPEGQVAPVLLSPNPPEVRSAPPGIPVVTAASSGGFHLKHFTAAGWVRDQVSLLTVPEHCTGF